MRGLPLPLYRLLVACFVAISIVGYVESNTSQTCAAENTAEIIGRWDLVAKSGSGEYPSWLEVRRSGNSALVGSYVGQFGSSRPIGKIEKSDGGYRFTVPPQWEKRSDDLDFKFRLQDEKLVGETTDEMGRRVTWVGQRAPALKRSGKVEWGKPIELFNGEDLSGWVPLMKDVPNGWVASHGVLSNAKPGNNIATKQKFTDFRLHAEFRYPKGSNSGIYLRGRYEVQVEDNFGSDPESHKIGGVYGFLTPATNAAKQHGEWQVYDIELIGRTVTVHLNGERVIDRQEIPGITGGALDSNEGEPGPIYLQGDHGPVEFRKLTITPAK